MKVLKSRMELADWRKNEDSKSLGFVPTMGALHQGHSELIQKSLMEQKKTVVSIFLNPTQFDNAQDLQTYPSQFDSDLQILSQLNVDAVFAPKEDDLYPHGYRYRVVESELSQVLCGAKRPGHFEGVLTVVMKLLNLVRPSHAYFGEKDFQQLSLVKEMINDFFMPIEVVSVPTVREVDGLALSSRNLKLNPQQRALAPKLYEVISSKKSDETAVKELAANGFKVDYVKTIRGRRFAAASLGAVRLIDNVQL